MILQVNSFEKYSDFIMELTNNPLYYDPHFAYNKENLYGFSKKKNQYAFVVLNEQKVIGLFVWLIIPDEKYIEMLIGFTNNEKAFLEMLSYLEKGYSDYRYDFVVNPKNTALLELLKKRNAFFEKEQQRMCSIADLPDLSTDMIELYSEKWKEQYCSIH